MDRVGRTETESGPCVPASRGGKGTSRVGGAPDDRQGDAASLECGVSPFLQPRSGVILVATGFSRWSTISLDASAVGATDLPSLRDLTLFASEFHRLKPVATGRSPLRGLPRYSRSRT